MTFLTTVSSLGQLRHVTMTSDDAAIARSRSERVLSRLTEDEEAIRRDAKLEQEMKQLAATRSAAAAAQHAAVVAKAEHARRHADEQRVRQDLAMQSARGEFVEHLAREERALQQAVKARAAQGLAMEKMLRRRMAAKEPWRRDREQLRADGAAVGMHRRGAPLGPG